MRENKVKSIWAAGGAVINGWCAISDSYAAEVMAHAGFDAVTVDQQHGMIDFQASISMYQAISTTDTVPLTRVPWNDPAPIMKALDAGAYGVICPMINNREETEKFVGACHYPALGEPSLGYRSMGPARGVLYGGSDYFQAANDTIVTIAMIETMEALKNLDAIMTTPGLDGIYIGPNDLAIGLGYPPHPDPDRPEVLAAIDDVLAKAKEHGLAAGIHCASGDMAKRNIDKGFQLCTVANDARLMTIGASQEIAAARGK